MMSIAGVEINAVSEVLFYANRATCHDPFLKTLVDVKTLEWVDDDRRSCSRVERFE